MRVPGVIKWPGVVEPGAMFDQPTSHLDIYPTLANIAGTKTTGVYKVPFPPPREVYQVCRGRILSCEEVKGDLIFGKKIKIKENKDESSVGAV